MRSGNRVCLCGAAILCSALLVRGGLETWVQHAPAGPAIGALFRSVPMPGGAVPYLRPPAESRPELARLIAAAPREAMLYRLRAQEDEVALDFAAAEADWKAYAAHAADAYPAQLELAEFYRRRVRPRDELAALTAASAAKDDPLLPATAQRAWQAFERMASVVAQNALPESVAAPVFRAWVARYPKQPDAWRKLIDFLASRRDFVAAGTEIARFAAAFHDDLEAVRMRADLELSRGDPHAALALYDRAFQPLWPEDMRAAYFKLLQEQGQLREFAGRARTALAVNPADLDAAARLFRYFRSQNNMAAARRTLLEYRIAKESGRQPWTAGELQTAARLFESLPDVNEAARLYYALYSAPPVAGPQVERALYGLANLLLTTPDQPIQFGTGDLSFYKDIATLDSSPGFLNGILSLVLNWTGPRSEYQNQNQKSAAYFHRAAAAQLVTLLAQRFPNSGYLAPLRAALIRAYGDYGDDAEVVRAGREYLAAFPNGAARVSVAMQVSDALARANRTAEEFALYEQLLRELAAKAAGVPIGSNSPPAMPLPDPTPQTPQPNPAGARSGEYVQVLNKYLSRLSALNRPLDALRVYRTEIDRNPNDPGLYERLAAFLQQNGMSRDVEDLYAKAIARFTDPSWYDKLARWYLRTRQTAALEKISRDVIAIFSGAELERYFTEIVSQTHPDAALYRQLNLYAHDRFPEDLAFVHNLLNAYAQPQTRDPAAAERLLRQYWFYETGLRNALFERLSQQGKLYPELAEIRAANAASANGEFDRAVAANPAAVQFNVEAEVWLSHFEAAAPAARALAAAYPGRAEFTSKASSLYRSLAAYDPRDTEIAVTLAGYEQRANPSNPAILARMGDILADRELFARARTFWDRMPSAQPGNAEAYLDAATVYWDYYRYNDALRWIAAARAKFGQPALFAYQAGAIYENRRDFAGAVREYLAGALDGDEPADNRLLRLATRAQTRALVDRATAAAVAANPPPQLVSLRLAVLEAQQRRPALEALLQARVDLEKSSTQLANLQETARRLGFDVIEERAGERLAAITNDPVDKMRLTLANARLLESKKDLAGAARVVDALYRDHPLILGVVRGAVDFHVRIRQPNEAIDILLDAAKKARAGLAAQFTLESARIATAAGEFDRARTLLAGLLSADPLRGEYLAAMADTYLQAKDDRGFRDYQLATILRLKQSQLPPAQRAERLAAVRRSLIPALDRLRDAAGAVDQYIEVIDSYPEDEALAKEAASYAVSHAQAARLVAFYRKTQTQAPLDYRWPVVLARIETVTEDYPDAISDYERGIKARPDRADLFEAKGRLEEHLMRFDDAIKTYTRLYELAYRDPVWLSKVAELQARSGRNTEAVDALKTAVIGARTETADADFDIAGRLQSWHILPAAVTFADRGATLEAADLFKHASHAAIYAEIMAAARRMDEVLSRLGADSATDDAVRRACSVVIAQTYTPEEKAHLEQIMTARAAGLDLVGRSTLLRPLAELAGLTGLESRWRLESMSAQDPQRAQLDPRFAALQSERGLYGELGRQLEDVAARFSGRSLEGGALNQAAQAFSADGDIAGELRVMRKALARNALSGALLDRYLSLIAARQPDELLAVVRGNASSAIRNRAVQFALAGDRPALAYSAIEARGRTLPPVWTTAYTSLAGVYFDDRSPAIDDAFQASLDTRTIGERLKTPLKPDTVIVGSLWFYFGARYGDYLASGHNPAAEGWLPASLEAAPENAAAYIALGDSYAQAGERAKAITQFQHALELDPDRGDAEDRIARVLWSDGRRADAVARWKAALSIFLKIQSRGVRVPEPFWNRVTETFTAIGERHAIGELRVDIAHLLGDYYHRNNQYRLSELIDAAARASLVSGEGIDWLLDLGRSMDDPEMIVSALMGAPGLTGAQRIALQRDRIAVLAKRAEGSFGDARQVLEAEVAGSRVVLISMLLRDDDLKGAAAEWSLLPPAGPRSRWEGNQLRDDVEIQLSAKTGALAALLERYRAQPASAPSPESLRSAAVALSNDGDATGARIVLQFLYERELQQGRLDAANFLGLAEVRLQQGDAPAAMALLNRMALVVEDGFETLTPAAGLLAKYGRTAESADFLRRRMKAVPWDSAAKVQLARTLLNSSSERERLLTAAVTDSLAEYKLRAGAARLARPHPPAGVTGELALLSLPSISAGDAAKPYQVEARIDAAAQVSDPAAKLRLWQEALAIAPSDLRVRLGALRAALALRRDSLALAIEQTTVQTNAWTNAPYNLVLRYFALQPQAPGAVLSQLSAPDRVAMEESLSAAAERLDDLNAALAHLQSAIQETPANQRAALFRRRDELTAEIERRARNAARQPVFTDNIEQSQVVRPRILRSVQ